MGQWGNDFLRIFLRTIVPVAVIIGLMYVLTRGNEWLSGSVVGSAVVGAMILWRRPRNRW